MKRQSRGKLAGKILNTIFPTRISTLADLVLPYIENGDKVLDLGAGTGKIAEYILDRKKIKLTLLDVTDEYKETDLEIQLYDGVKVPYKSNSFDCVLIIATLHHCDDPGQVLREAARVSKDRILIKEDKVDSKLDFFLLEFWHTAVSFLLGQDLLFSFKRNAVWRRMCKKLGLKLYKTQEIRSPFYKPTKQILYVLKK